MFAAWGWFASTITVRWRCWTGASTRPHATTGDAQRLGLASAGHVASAVSRRCLRRTLLSERSVNITAVLSSDCSGFMRAFVAVERAVLGSRRFRVHSEMTRLVAMSGSSQRRSAALFVDTQVAGVVSYDRTATFIVDARQLDDDVSADGLRDHRRVSADCFLANHSEIILDPVCTGSCFLQADLFSQWQASSRTPYPFGERSFPAARRTVYHRSAIQLWLRRVNPWCLECMMTSHGAAGITVYAWRCAERRKHWSSLYQQR